MVLGLTESLAPDYPIKSECVIQQIPGDSSVLSLWKFWRPTYIITWWAPEYCFCSFGIGLYQRICISGQFLGLLCFVVTALGEAGIFLELGSVSLLLVPPFPVAAKEFFFFVSLFNV